MWCGRAGRVVRRRPSGARCKQTSTRRRGGFLGRRRVGAGASPGRSAGDSLARAVLVVGVLEQVKPAQSVGFVDERSLLGVRQLAPARSQTLTDLGVVHVRPHRRDLLSLDLRTRPYNNDDDDNYDDAYGAVIMTKVIARVHPVHTINID